MHRPEKRGQITYEWRHLRAHYQIYSNVILHFANLRDISVFGRKEQDFDISERFACDTR